MFTDSFRFMSSSLSSLGDNLSEGTDTFIINIRTEDFYEDTVKPV